MSQGVNSARLTNTGVNVVGAVATTVTNYGPSSIAVAGNNFDVSSPGTLVLGSTGNVTIGNTGAGFITRFNTPITLGPAPSSTQTGCIGCVLSTNLSPATNVTSSGTVAILSITVPSAGIWLATYTVRLAPFTSGTTYTVTRLLTFLLPTINGVAGVNYCAQIENSATQTINATTLIAHSASFVFNIPTITSTTSIGLLTIFTASTTLVSQNNETYLQLVRIA